MPTNTVMGNFDGGKRSSGFALPLASLEAQQTYREFSLNDAFKEGLQPVIRGMRKGHITEEQAFVLIEMLLAGYVAATINNQIEGTFNRWAEGISIALTGGYDGRR